MKLTASRIRKLKKKKKKIKTWKVWWSGSMSGFHHYTDITLYKLAASSEPMPDAVIYGLNASESLSLEELELAKEHHFLDVTASTFLRNVVYDSLDGSR